MTNSETTTKDELINYKDIPRLYPQSILNKKAYTIRTEKNFIKSSMINLDYLSDESFTPSETKILFKMLTLLKLDKVCNGVLQVNGIPVNKTQLKNHFKKMSINTFDDSIKKLEAKEIIKRVKFHNGTMYYVNPFIFLNGEMVEPTTFALFYQSKWNRFGE